jgi:hypothetical protein
MWFLVYREQERSTITKTVDNTGLGILSIADSRTVHLNALFPFLAFVSYTIQIHFIVFFLLTVYILPRLLVMQVFTLADKPITIQVKTMTEGNKQGWKLGTDICERKNNDLLYTILVKLSGNEPEYYIYKYDVLFEKVENLYSQFLLKPKRDGGQRKDISFR